MLIVESCTCKKERKRKIEGQGEAGEENRGGGGGGGGERGSWWCLGSSDADNDREFDYWLSRACGEGV